MKDFSFAIVIPVYNRIESLKRLLISLKNSYYLDDEIKLIISIDKSNNKIIENIVNNYKWNYGEKIIIKNKKHLGLKKHIIKCGNLTNKYGNIILLEDDLFVSKYFYLYAKSALNYYSRNENIAGVSLYAPEINETVDFPFNPVKENSDGYFIQLPSSWGQVWSPKQWENFMKWYSANTGNFKFGENIPDNIRNWPDSSWKKYFSLYMIEKNKFFLYPYISHTTNFGEPGTHLKFRSSKYQVKLSHYANNEYKFKDFNIIKAKYNIFLENISLKNYFKVALNSDNVLIDIYGSTKNTGGYRYFLTTKLLNYKIIESYGLELKPPELNIFNKIDGDDIFLYDTSFLENNSYKNKKKRYVSFYNYFYPGLSFKKSIRYIIEKVLNKVESLVFGYFQKIKNYFL